MAPGGGGAVHNVGAEVCLLVLGDQEEVGEALQAAGRHLLRRGERHGTRPDDEDPLEMNTDRQHRVRLVQVEQGEGRLDLACSVQHCQVSRLVGQLLPWFCHLELIKDSYS